MGNLLTKLQNMIRRAKVTKPGADNGNYAVTQVQYMGKTVNMELLNPYGMASSPPVDSLAIVMAIQGQEENRVGMAYRPDLRPKELAPGEVAFGNFLLSKFFKFNADGTVTLNADLIINANLTVTGSTTLGATVTSNGVDISDTHTHTGSPTAPSGAQSNTGEPI